MLVFVVSVLIAAAAGGAAAVVAHRRGSTPAGQSWLEERTAERLRVHTTEGQSIEGSLIHTASDGIVLAAVRLVDAEVDLAGDLWIPRPKVLMIQRVT